MRYMGKDDFVTYAKHIIFNGVCYITISIQTLLIFNARQMTSNQSTRTSEP